MKKSLVTLVLVSAALLLPACHKKTTTTPNKDVVTVASIDQTAKDQTEISTETIELFDHYEQVIEERVTQALAEQESEATPEMLALASATTCDKDDQTIDISISKF